MINLMANSYPGWDAFPSPSSSHYFQRYVRMMEYRILHPAVGKYTERHHIRPRWMNGSNKKWNVAYLSSREHLIVHRILWKALRSKESCRAYNLMLSVVPARNTKEVAALRERHAELMIGASNPMYGCRRPDLAERNRLTVRRGKENPLYGIPLSDATKEKISKAKRGQGLGRKKPVQSERMRGAGNPLFGKRNERFSAFLKAVGAIVSICPHCGRKGKGRVMKRWHFERCAHA